MGGKKDLANASITYEAALILPVFVGILVFYLSFYHLLQIQEILSSAAHYAAEEASLYGFLGKGDLSGDTGEEDTGILQAYLMDFFNQAAGTAYFTARFSLLLPEEKLDKRFLKGGIHSISFVGSELLTEDHVVIQIQYPFRFPVFGNLLPSLEVRQRIVMRSYTGHRIAKKGTEAEEGASTQVYVAETGTVYHLDRNCTYIKLSLKEASSGMVVQMRSKGGGKYYACSICKGQAQTSYIVYYTDYGNRYHNTLNCSGIKRHISIIDLADVGDRRPCSKCCGKE